MNDYYKKNITLRERKKAFRSWFWGAAGRTLLLMLAIFFGLMYLLQTSSASTQGYKISDLEKQIRALEQKNQKLEFEIATHRSMKSIQQRLPGVELVAADKVEYVTLLAPAVALR